MNPNNRSRSHILPLRHLGVVLALGIAVTTSACGGATTQGVTTAGATTSATQPTAAEVSPYGDVPDNAVFVTYQSKDGGYSVQYVEGWAVTPGTNGAVTITDIDSAETVDLRDLPAGELTNYVTTTDVSQLKSQVQDYQQRDLKTVTVNGQSIIELTYTSTSAPDTVTNKSRAVVSQRYYIPSPNSRLAILTLTTPDGVDNVDAFRQMLESFTWQ